MQLPRVALSEDSYRLHLWSRLWEMQKSQQGDFYPDSKEICCLTGATGMGIYFIGANGSMAPPSHKRPLHVTRRSARLGCVNFINSGLELGWSGEPTLLKCRRARIHDERFRRFPLSGPTRGDHLPRRSDRTGQGESGLAQQPTTQAAQGHLSHGNRHFQPYPL